ncbi:MAG TPA: right-handed parallel beta-helix repeat-containing protein [bacterium]|nr:right-handed parallel beta-helix repeat-containing protein [bacterium]
MKKTKLFLSLAFFAAAIALHADTQVPSSINTDTQWEASGNPYIIQGKVTVAKGATLHIGPNVRVQFRGPAGLEVDGTLNAEGSAAAPVVLDMTEGGLKSELFLNGATALLTNVRVLGGVFLVQDTQLHLQWFEITKGSGLYLRGATTANVKNGKIYGNATGLVLDGTIQGTFQFNTLTQNTYGLFLKNFSYVSFTYNSVHDNDKDVVNSSTTTAPLGGNYWGNMDEKTILSKTQGPVDLEPVRDLKEILRRYIRTQLPTITKEQEKALKDREKKQAESEAAKNPTPEPAVAPETPAAPAPEAPAETTPEAPAAPEAAPAPEETPAAPEASSAPAGVAPVKDLPAAPHKLKTLTLPADQGDLSKIPGHVPGPSEKPVATVGPETVGAPSAAPEAPAPAAAPEESPAPPPMPMGSETAPPPPAESGTLSPVGSESGTMPPPPQIDVTAPPDLDGNSASPSTPPPPPLPASAAETAAPTPVVETVPLAPPPVPQSSVAPSDNVSVPPPPALNEQMAPSVAPAPPSAPPTPAPTPVPTVSAEDQQKALESLDGVSGDIDGMQAPPLDLNLDLAPSDKAGNNKTGLTLPPMKDSNVAPPKDLDLPPTDDSGTLTPAK